MDTVQDMVDISTAAKQIGITPEAVRKRIGRGTLAATKQNGRWHVIPDAINRHHVQDTGQNVQDDHPDARDKLIQILTEEVEARRREVQELHVLLQTAQGALTAPKRHPWWRRLW